MMRSDSQHSPLPEMERRISPRMAIDRFVYVTVAPGHGGMLVDLGEGGMCISVANPLVLSTAIHFSFMFEGHRIVQGMGRVCWRSQSGEKAGVQFVGLSSDLRAFIRKRLGIGNVTSSLMFLPGSSKPMQPLCRAEQPAANEDPSLGTDVLRAAIASRPLPTNNNDAGFKGILLGTAICAVLVALGVMIHSYPGMLGKLAGLTPVAGTQPASEPVEAVGFRGFTRSVKRSKAFLRDGAPGQPIRSTAIFYDPDQNEARFSIEITDSSREQWLAMVTNQDLTLSETSYTIPEGRSASSGNDTSQAPPMSAAGLSLQFKGLMKGTLRNDGALVVEGAQRSSPSNPGIRKGVPKPIVLEAMVGRDGTVRKVQLISPPDAKLAGVVVAAVRRWRYRPLYENGRAIEFATRITFDFWGPNSQASN